MKQFFLTVFFIFLFGFVTFSYSWKLTDKGWIVLDDKGNMVKNTWYCDNRKGTNDWYILDENGYLVTNEVVSQTDKKGKKHYYLLSQDAATLGKMIVTNGQYKGLYLSFNQEKDSFYGEITINYEGIKELIMNFNVKSYNSISTSYVYANTLTTNNTMLMSKTTSGAAGGGGGGGTASTHTHTYTWEVIREASETERGVKLGTCTICGRQRYVYGRVGGDIDEDATRDEIEGYIGHNTCSYTYYIAIDNFVTGADNFIVAPYKLRSNYQLTVAQALKKLSEIKNFTLISNNSFTNGWYLNRIKMDGIGPQTIYKVDIPECLRSHVTTSALTKRTASNILGGQDYTTEAGWMYMVNGEHGSVSMAAYNLEDNDVVRIVFSLYGWGADVGSPWGSYYDYAFLTDEIKAVANGNMSLSELVDKAKKLRMEE